MHVIGGFVEINVKHVLQIIAHCIIHCNKHMCQTKLVICTQQLPVRDGEPILHLPVTKNSRHIHKERQNPQHKLREVVMGSQEELLITGEWLLWLCLLASAPWIFETIVTTQLH